MKSILKSFLKGILKISLVIAILSTILVSILLVLEYVSPKLDVFPLYAITAVSILWLGFFSIPFLLTSSRKSRLRAMKGTRAVKRSLQPYFQPAFDFSARIYVAAKTLYAGKSKSKNAANAKSQTGRRANQAAEPIGIFFINNHNETAQPKVSTVKLLTK